MKGICRYRAKCNQTLSFSHHSSSISKGQKQPSRGVLRKRCSENIQEIYRATSMPKYMISIKLLCNFLEITLRDRYSPVNLLHIFRPPFPKNTSGRLLLKSASWVLYNFHQTEIETENDGHICLKQKRSLSIFS